MLIHRVTCVCSVLFAAACLAAEPEPPTVVASFDDMPKPVGLSDGTLIAYTIHHGRYGLGPLPDAQQVLARISRDRGDTWTEPQPVLSLPADAGGFGFYGTGVDAQDRVHLFMLNDANEGVIRPIYDENGRRQVQPLARQRLDIWHARSQPGGLEWSPPQKIWEGRAGDPMGATVLQSGRMLLPICYFTPRSWANRGEGPAAYTFVGRTEVAVLYSDDGGDTWQLGEQRLTAPVPTLYNYGAVEPVAFELRDGRVWMLTRTQMGRLYEAFSRDGIHWSEFAPTRFHASDSPARPIRLDDGRIVLIWNNCQRFPYALGGRHVLHAAISSDEGRTWRGYREILRDPNRNEPPPPRGDFGVSYPFVAVTDDDRVVYALWVTTAHGRSLYRFDPDWLLATEQVEDFSDGLRGWSIFGTRGAELVREAGADGGDALRLGKVEQGWESAAVWNFPLGAAGRLHLRVKAEPGFGGAMLGLTDHFSPPFDVQAGCHNVFNVELAADGGASADAVKMTPGAWHELIVSWDVGACQARVMLDGAASQTVPLQRRGEGVCYLRLRYTGDQTSAGGLLVDHAKVIVQPPAAHP